MFITRYTSGSVLQPFAKRTALRSSATISLRTWNWSSSTRQTSPRRIVARSLSTKPFQTFSTKPPIKADTVSKKMQAKRPKYATDAQGEPTDLYPVFCTVDIPAEILDEFIDEAHQGTFSMVDDGVVGGAVCIIDTEDLNSITQRSVKPMKAFKSPFLGRTDNEIRSWMKQHVQASEMFNHFTFTILDADTIKNKTCRIGYVGEDERMLVSDFFAPLIVGVSLAAGVRLWEEYEYLGLGTSQVYNSKENAREAEEERRKRLESDVPK